MLASPPFGWDRRVDRTESRRGRVAAPRTAVSAGEGGWEKDVDSAIADVVVMS